jgi:hypothetical protein
MSLQHLTAMRIGGKAPRTIWILVGNIPKWIDDDHQYIQILPSDKPQHIDFRSLVSLNVVIFEIGQHESLLLQTIKAIESAKPKEISIACNDGIVGISEKHEDVLRKALRLLCQ